MPDTKARWLELEQRWAGIHGIFWESQRALSIMSEDDRGELIQLRRTYGYAYPKVLV